MKPQPAIITAATDAPIGDQKKRVFYVKKDEKVSFIQRSMNWMRDADTFLAATFLSLFTIVRECCEWIGLLPVWRWTVRFVSDAFNLVFRTLMFKLWHVLATSVYYIWSRTVRGICAFYAFWWSTLLMWTCMFFGLALLCAASDSLMVWVSKRHFSDVSMQSLLDSATLRANAFTQSAADRLDLATPVDKFEFFFRQVAQADEDLKDRNAIVSIDDLTTHIAKQISTQCHIPSIYNNDVEDHKRSWRGKKKPKSAEVAKDSDGADKSWKRTLFDTSSFDALFKAIKDDMNHTMDDYKQRVRNILLARSPHNVYTLYPRLTAGQWEWKMVNWAHAGCQSLLFTWSLPIVGPLVLPFAIYGNHGTLFAFVPYYAARFASLAGEVWVHVWHVLVDLVGSDSYRFCEWFIVDLFVPLFITIPYRIFLWATFHMLSAAAWTFKVASFVFGICWTSVASAVAGVGRFVSTILLLISSQLQVLT